MKKICLIVLLAIVMLSGCGSVHEFVVHNLNNYFKPVGDQQDVQSLKQCLKANDPESGYYPCTKETRFGFDYMAMGDYTSCLRRMQKESKRMTGSFDKYGKTELGREIFHGCMIEKGYIYLPDEE